MNRIHPRPMPSLIAVTVVAIALGGLAPAAQARERQATVTGAHGKTATRSVARSGGDVSSSSTGPNGGTRSRTVDRSSTGTQATLSGPNGATATRSTVKTETGSTTTVTGANGKSGTIEVSRRR